MSSHSKALLDSLPAVIDNSITEIDLNSYTGEAPILLLFYPGNFGPRVAHSISTLEACNRLAERIEPATNVFGISTESALSQKQFAINASLQIPLISDLSGHLAQGFDVVGQSFGGQQIPQLALFVINYQGNVIFSWRADCPAEEPPLNKVEAVITDIPSENAAAGRYRVAHAHYTEGHRHLSCGLSDYEDQNWVRAATEFTDASTEFEEATDLFIKSQTTNEGRVYQLANQGRLRATKFWEVSEWLAGFATAAKNNSSERRQVTKQEAHQALLEAKDLEPVLDPDEI